MNENNNKKDLKKVILNEYLFFLGAILLRVLYIIPELAISEFSDSLSNLGSILFLHFLVRGIRYTAIIAFCIVRPIKILNSYKNEIEMVTPSIKKIFTVVVIALPIILSILIVTLEMPIMGYME